MHDKFMATDEAKMKDNAEKLKRTEKILFDSLTGAEDKIGNSTYLTVQRSIDCELLPFVYDAKETLADINRRFYFSSATDRKMTGCYFSLQMSLRNRK